MQGIFITGTGTDVGKTVAAATLVEALNAEYWKPVQAGFENGTDSQWINYVVPHAQVHQESYKLKMPASPHIAAKRENIRIELSRIQADFENIMRSSGSEYLVIEGAGGLMVPLNEDEFVLDLVKKLDVTVILVSRNYLGSINHSLLTAEMCRKSGIDVKGWMFNDQYLDYENEIVDWTGYEKIGSIPRSEVINREFIIQQAEKIRQSWKQLSTQKQH